MTGADSQDGGQQPAPPAATAPSTSNEPFTAASLLTSARQLLYDLATPLPDEHIRKPGECG